MYINQPLIPDPQTYLDYDGLVRLVVRVSPWRMVFHLKGVALGAHGLVAELDRRELDDDLGKEDIQLMLREGAEYSLPLEYAHAPVSYPVVSARLVQTDRTAAGLRLEFQFTETNDDLMLMTEELEKRQHERGRHIH